MHWMLGQVSSCDLHTVLKACYFADKTHLNENNRPIFGATYRAMKFGPVPLEIYQMAKGDPLFLAELQADSYPWKLQGYHLRLDTNGSPDTDVLSETDMAAISSGFTRSSKMSFDERTLATHGHDWQVANLGIMKYEDMIDETPNKAEIVAYLREAAPFMRL